MTLDTERVPDVEYRGKVRDRDPETSWAAAGSQTRHGNASLRGHIVAVLRRKGALTHDEIYAQYLALNTESPDLHPMATPQSVRTRTSELHVAGTIRPTGAKRPSNTGKPAQLWELT